MTEVWKPHVTVAAVVAHQNRFLLVEEEVDGGVVYNQPAGHLDPGESLLEAVAREALEETARRFEPEALVGVYRWCNPENGETFVRFCFTGAVSDPEPGRALDTGILRAVWLTRDEMDRVAIRSPLVTTAVDDYLAGARYPLDLLREI